MIDFVTRPETETKTQHAPVEENSLGYELTALFTAHSQAHFPSLETIGREKKRLRVEKVLLASLSVSFRL